MNTIYEIRYRNGKRYIGKDSKWPTRRDQHIQSSKKDTPTQLCEKKMREHGFLFIDPIVQDLTEEEANMAEIFFIKLFRTNICEWGDMSRGYNLTSGGDGVSGFKMSNEAKEKMRLAKLGKPGNARGSKRTEETIRKLSESRKGRPVSDETKRKISEKMKGIPKPHFKGRILSEEHKRKIAEANRGRPKSEEAKRKMKEASKGKPKPHLKGRKHSEETKRKISDARRKQNDI